MIEPRQNPELLYITSMLIHYGFDLGVNDPQELIKKWMTQYDPYWIRLAVIEALYQGRYKAISVVQILNVWQRKGKITYHFNREFERLIARHFPASLIENIEYSPLEELPLNHDENVITEQHPDQEISSYNSETEESISQQVETDLTEIFADMYRDEIETIEPLSLPKHQ
ncbi:MAG TPA: hypothetical protein V6C58_03015, partial [Allocoleopsis sp.]